MQPKSKKAQLIASFKQRIEGLREVKEGTWLTHLIKRLVEEHARTSRGEYFKHKYPSLDPERLSHRLIATSAHSAGLSGAAAASAVTAAELGAVETGGALVAVGISAVIGEISTTTYIQLRMIYDISVLFDAPFDLDDPEDLMAMFWYAFGVDKWEDAANAFLKAGPRTAEYLGRKALRSGLRKALQQVAGRLGGQQLARKITERALLRLIVPGVNIPIAYTVNRWFTSKLGQIVITHLKTKTATLGAFKKLGRATRSQQLLGLALIQQIGIQDEDPRIYSRVIEMFDVALRFVELTEADAEELERLAAMQPNEFLEEAKRESDKSVIAEWLEIASISHLLSNASRPSKAKLYSFASGCGAPINEDHLKELKRSI